MTADYWRWDNDPYIACHNGYSLHVNYKNCGECPHSEYCDIYALDKLEEAIEQEEDE